MIIDARNGILTMMEEIANNLLQQHGRALSQSSNVMQVIHIDEKGIGLSFLYYGMR